MGLIVDSFVSIFHAFLHSADPVVSKKEVVSLDGRRCQRFNIVSLLIFESFTSNFIMSEHKLTYC